MSQEDQDLETYHFGSHTRLYRKEKKYAQRNDRSGNKKSDRDQEKKRQEHFAKQLEKEIQNSDIQGTVIEIRGQEVLVDCQTKLLTCSLKGSFKGKKRNEKNIIAVGDRVGIRLEGTHSGLIEYIAPRHGLLHRSDNLNRNKLQLLAVNVDWVIITASVVSPLLRPSLIDRYLIAAKIGQLNAALCINKLDLLQTTDSHAQSQKQLLQECLQIYGQLDIPCFTLSTNENSKDSFQELAEFLKGKTAVFSGQSGVGKSTIINRLTGLQLKTREVVSHTRKGAHTTSKARLIALKEKQGWVVDTPGIKSFGIWEADWNKIQLGFPEIFQVGQNCKFKDCQHQNEPGCLVKEAVELGEIHPIRYESYCQLCAELHAKYLRR